MTKDELIARLQVLGEQLNRDVSLTGTKEELALRVAELEEELDDTDDAAGQDTSVSPENALTGHENEVVSAQPDTVTDTADLVTVVALVTLHTDALHATRDEAVAFVLPGTAFRVSAGVAAEMTERVEGSSPSLFVRTDDVRQLRRGDTLTIGEENFWIDRISPDDGGSCHLWLGRGVPPAVNRRRWKGDVWP